MSSNLVHQRIGYRQGLVLGLTMAEVMLVLVFCLLMTAGALLQREHRRADKYKNEVQVLRSETVSNRPKPVLRALENAGYDKLPANTVVRLIEQSKQIADAAGKTEILNEWRRLVRADSILKDLEKRGHNPDSLVEELQSLDNFRKLLRDEGYGKMQPAKAIATLRERLAQEAKLRKQAGLHNWPPIIRLSEADGYYFKLGSAELSTNFRQRLHDTVVPRLLDILSRYPVDVVEVIGHTDQVPIKSRTSNLDSKLIDVLSGRANEGELIASDNAGLGMTRAVSVALALMNDDRLKRLTDVRILPLSGAQVILPTDRLATGGESGDVRELRRIEIRVRQSCGKLKAC